MANHKKKGKNKGQKPVETFDQKLERLEALGNEILTGAISEENAQQRKNSLVQYGSLSAELESSELTAQQRGQLNRVRSEFPNAKERKAIQVTLDSVISSKEDKDAKAAEIQAGLEKNITETLAKMKALDPIVIKAAQAYFKANLENRGQLLEQYKALRDQFNVLIDSLKGGDSLIQRLGGKEQAHYRSQISKLNELINIQTASFVIQENQIKEQINKIVEEARAEVNQMTVQQMLFTIAPNATKKQILEILNSPQMRALLNQSGVKALEVNGVLALEVDNNGVLTLEAPGATGSQGGALVLADFPLAKLPADTQVALIAAIFNQLSAISTDTSEGALTQRFIQTIVKDVEALRSGAKTHLSLVVNIKNKETDENRIQVLHVDLLQLISDPGMISRILFQFVSQGVTNENIVMNLSTPTQVAALSTLNDLSTQALLQQGGVVDLAQITRKAIQFADEPKALARFTKTDVTKESLEQSLLVTTNSGQVGIPGRRRDVTLGKGFDNEAILKLLTEVVTLQVASAKLASELANTNGDLSELVNGSVGLATIEAGTRLGAIAGPTYPRLEGPQIAKLLQLRRIDPRALSAPDMATILCALPGSVTPLELTDRGIHSFTTEELVEALKGLPENLFQLDLADWGIQSYNVDQWADVLKTIPEGIFRLDLTDRSKEPLAIDAPEITKPVVADTPVVDTRFVATPVVAESGNAAEAEPTKPDATKKTRPRVDLDEQKFNFYELLQGLAKIRDDLDLKRADNPKYEDVVTAANKLHDDLDIIGDAFFKNPTRQGYELFKSKCKDSINEAEVEFKQHRGAWWDNSGFFGALLAITKAIIGIIAAISVIPGLTVHFGTKYGFAQTFFGTPEETNSSEELAKVKTGLEILEESIDPTALNNDENPDAEGINSTPK